MFFSKSIATEESKVHATTSLMVRNPLYSKVKKLCLCVYDSVSVCLYL